MLLTFGLLDESEVDALREKGYAVFFAHVDPNDTDCLKEVLMQKVNEAKDGDASFCLFVNVNSDGFVDALREGNHVDPDEIQRCWDEEEYEESSLEDLEDEDFFDEDIDS